MAKKADRVTFDVRTVAALLRAAAELVEADGRSAALSMRRLAEALERPPTETPEAARRRAA